MLHFSCVLVMALSLSLGKVVSALPQATTKPSPTSLSAPAASSIVAANPMVFPPQNNSKIPIPGAPSNSTLLQVVPQLKTLPNKTGGTKRDVPEGMEKRFDCINDLTPWAPDTLWDSYSVAFCNFYFPASVGTFWIPAGFCFSGTVPASGGYPNLNFNYCAKNPPVPYPVFVAVTNSICLSEFEGIVAYEDDEWFCPAYQGGTHPGQVYGGDNFNDATDSSTWQIFAS